MMLVHADGSALPGSIPGVGFGRQPDVYDGRPRGRPRVLPGQCAAKVPHGAGETRITHCAPNRPPAAPVSTEKMIGRAKARSSVSYGIGSLIAVTVSREGKASKQASEHLLKGCTPVTTTSDTQRVL
jgi:hypothetical protein